MTEKALESVAVIAKFDCRVFCHINSLENKISNTAATIQPNPFWFWEKSNLIYFNKVWYFISIRSSLQMIGIKVVLGSRYSIVAKTYG